MKNLDGKRFSKERILEFIDGKGFYVILTVCIVVVGITAVLISSGRFTGNREQEIGDLVSEEMAGELGENIEKDDSEEIVQSSKDSIVTDTEETSEDNLQTSDVSEDTKEVSDISEKQADNNTEMDMSTSFPQEQENETAVSSEVEGTTQQFIMPVLGEITFDFAMTKLVYSKTLQEWRTHSGIDIASSRGTPVKVVADGVVNQVKNDPRFGTTVIIEHEGGVKTVYASLVENTLVVPNQKVKQGDVIGSIGNTAIFETLQPSHLHFEVLLDDKPVDPKDYLEIGK